MRTAAVLRTRDRAMVSGIWVTIMPAPNPAAALSKESARPRDSASTGERTAMSSPLAADGSA